MDVSWGFIMDFSSSSFMNLYYGNTYTSPLEDFQFVNMKAICALPWALISAIMTYVVCRLHTAYVIVAVPVLVRVSQLHKASWGITMEVP